MNKTVAVLVLAGLALTACKKPEAEARLSASPPSAAASSDANTAVSPTEAAANTAASPQAPMLALAYKLGLVVPGDQVRPLMESHQEACERAGYDQCQVMGANAEADGDQQVSATLTLRATPAWMRLFRTRAEADAKDLGGKIDETTTEAEDLGAPIVDTEAAQRARAAERDRLTQLMRRKTRNLDQTLQVDKALTDVQAQMDQASSELTAMRGRVAMQTMTVSYQSAALATPRGDAAPLQAAAHGFMANVYAVLAGLLTVASFLFPFALVGAPIVWWLRRRKPAAP
jgi:hypothetical protein